MESIYNLDLESLKEYFINHNDKKFRAEQVYEWLYKKRVSSFEAMTNLKKETISMLNEDFSIKKLELVLVERDVDVNKYLFKLSDGEAQFLITCSRGEGLIKIGYTSAVIAIKPTQREFEFVETNLNKIIEKRKMGGGE